MPNYTCPLLKSCGVGQSEMGVYMDRKADLTETKKEVIDFCLNCPLEHCYYDAHVSDAHSGRESRNLKIYQEWRNTKKSYRQLAIQFSVSHNTVARLVKKWVNYLS